MFVGWRYQELPVLGALAWDVGQFDLAMRRAAFAARERIPLDRFLVADIRLSRRGGLQLRGAEPGSLELLLDIPVWIVAALASQPTTALVNLLTLIGAREAIRVRLRRVVLSADEESLLVEAQRAPAALPRPDDFDDRPLTPIELESGAGPTTAEVPVRQGRLPNEIRTRLEGSEPIVDVEVGSVRIRTPRPEIDVVVHENGVATSVSIQQPQR